MAAGGMAADHDALAEPLPEKEAGLLRLLDDFGDRHLRHQIVARHRDGDAVRVHAARQLAEHRGLERAPVAAVNEQRERRVGAAALGRENVDDLARRRTKFQAELGAAVGLGLLAIGRGVALPALEDFRMLRHPGAVVVFNLVVDGHEECSRRFRRELGSSMGCRQAGALIAAPATTPPKDGAGRLSMAGCVRFGHFQGNIVPA